MDLAFHAHICWMLFFGFCSFVLTATFAMFFLPILRQGRTLEDMEDKLAIERLDKKW